MDINMHLGPHLGYLEGSIPVKAALFMCSPLPVLQSTDPMPIWIAKHM